MKYFIKPFKSFSTNPKLPLKEQWRIAVKDPAFLIIWMIVIGLIYINFII